LTVPTDSAMVHLLLNKLPSPAWEAVRLWLPSFRTQRSSDLVLTPPVVLKLPWPRLVAPSEKITSPVGLATAVLPGALTMIVAVKVTSCPDTEELTEATTVVSVVRSEERRVGKAIRLKKLP